MVSKIGTDSMTIGTVNDTKARIFDNLVTIEPIQRNPKNNDPVSPIKIFAG